MLKSSNTEPLYQSGTIYTCGDGLFASTENVRCVLTPNLPGITTGHFPLMCQRFAQSLGLTGFRPDMKMCLYQSMTQSPGAYSKTENTKRRAWCPFIFLRPGLNYHHFDVTTAFTKCKHFISHVSPSQTNVFQYIKKYTCIDTYK